MEENNESSTNDADSSSGYVLIEDHLQNNNKLKINLATINSKHLWLLEFLFL